MGEIIYWQCEKCGVTFKANGKAAMMGNITIQLTGYAINAFEGTAQCICGKCQEKYRDQSIKAFRGFFNK